MTSLPFSSLPPASLLSRSATTVNHRFFSSTDLSEILAREHEEEIESDTTSMPQELSDLKATLSDWKIVEDAAMTKLYKQMDGGRKVQLSFHCQDTVAIAEDDDDEEEGDEAADPVRFTVTVTKAGKSLVFTCLSEDAKTTVEGVAMTSQDVESIHSTNIDRNLYQGPEFTELAEDLQEAFCEYLETEVGITEDVSAFVSMYADWKEQGEYVKFLEGAMSILK